MPTALVINPNTSSEMTAEIRETAEKVFRPPWRCLVEPAPAGPESLESWTDYHLASICVLPLIAGMEENIDGVVLACFGDPGLYVLKEYCRVPVVGIAEASIAVSLMLGAKFGILAGMRRAVELMDSMVQTYGAGPRYAGTQSLDMRVLNFEKDRGKTLRELEKAGLKLRQNGAEVLLLGCAGLTTFAEDLQASVEMPVVDPVEAGCRMLQLLCESRLNTSRAGLFRPAAPQTMNNLDRLFREKMRAAIRQPRAKK